MLQIRTLGRRRRIFPSRVSTRATVFLLGASLPSSRRRALEILSTPQVERCSRHSRMRTMTSSPVVSGLDCGRRLCSLKPV
jgi:hypothetical protein